MTPEIWFPHLGIEIEKLSRVAFSVFSIEIYWYSIIIALGVFMGLLVATKEAKRTNQNPELYSDFLMYAFIFSIIGARAYYVIFAWDTYKDDLLSIFATRQGGIAIYGAVIASFCTAYVFTKKKKIDFLLFLDTCAPGLVIGQAIGRWGNFINREAFGGYTDSIFALRYMKNQVTDLTPNILANIVTFNGVEYVQVHPTFLYESIWNLCLFVFLMVYIKHKKFNGEIAALYFVLYGIGRFWIEGLRTDQLIFFKTGLATSQILSVILVVFGLGYIIYMRTKIKKHCKV